MKKLFYSLKKSLITSWYEYSDYKLLNKELERFRKELKKEFNVEEVCGAFIEPYFKEDISKDYAIPRFTIDTYKQFERISYEALADKLYGSRTQALTRLIKAVVAAHKNNIKIRIKELGCVSKLYFRSIKGEIYIDPVTRDLVVDIRSRYKILPDSCIYKSIPEFEEKCHPSIK
jgi:hypothetical protein